MKEQSLTWIIKNAKWGYCFNLWHSRGCSWLTLPSREGNIILKWEVKFPVKRRLITSTMGQCNRLTAEVLLSYTACSEQSPLITCPECTRELCLQMESSTVNNLRWAEEKQVSLIKIQKSKLSSFFNHVCFNSFMLRSKAKRGQMGITVSSVCKDLKSHLFCEYFY